MKQGKIIILTAPSGSGKTTLAKRLMEEFPNIRFSVSATTRKPREGEVNGQHYYFITKNDFNQKVLDGEFLEHEEFYNGTRYGTLKSDVENQLKKGYFVLLDIEVKGAINIKSQFGHDCLSVFVRPPSIKELENRLSARGTETKDSLRLRLERAEMELEFESNFDAVVVNDNLEQAYQNLKIIIESYLNR
jgi:guanylate kinase